MVQIWSNSHTFKHSFPQTSFAYWRKYPSEQRPDIKSIDLLQRDFDPKTGILKTKRLVTMDINVPSWLAKLFGISSRAYFLEEAEFNSKQKKISTVSRNISFSNLVESIEYCTYCQHPENPLWTLFHQKANVIATGFLGFGSAIEELMMSTFHKNVAKGRELMENTINLIKKEADEGLIWVEGLGNKWKFESEQFAQELGNKWKFESEQLAQELGRLTQETRVLSDSVSLDNLN